jgi:sterol desaturase/sphingolipid hydroxylase (fatty acid hydroxylase superfamily)
MLAATYNLWAVVIYLSLNVLFGIVGHLGFEPLAAYKSGWIRYLGTSDFHHAHHRDIHGNFGFYTSLWDRLFGTYIR